MSLGIIICIFLVLNISVVILNRKIASLINIYDNPDGVRKIHVGRIPLLGGTIIFANLALLAIIKLLDTNISIFIDINEDIKNHYSFFLGILFFYLIGLIDDKLNLEALYKFIVMIFFLGFILILDKSLVIQYVEFTFVSRTFDLGLFSFPFTILCFMLLLNAYNMFDGINLQAGLYSIFIFIFFLYQDMMILFSLVMLLSLLSICFLNFFNKSFMGNSGTYLISFIVGYLFIKLYNERLISYTDEVFLIMMIPGIDLMRLFFIRLIKQRSPFSPDRNHLHHLLLEKYGYKISILLIIFLFVTPVLLDLYLATFHSILIGLTSYVIFLFLTGLKR